MLGDYFGTDTYKSKDVITYAADAIVYINGVGTKIVSPINNKLRKVSFQDDLMTITTNLTIEGAGTGSASLSLTVPRHSEKQYFKYGHCVIKPMMEVEIYFKGRFLTDSGSPVYYPAYWGLVTDVSVDYSGGQHTVDIQCMDILFFWSRSMITTNGSLFTPAWDPEAQKTEYVNIFNHMTPHEIILALAFVMHGTLTTPDVALSNKKDGGVRSRGIFQTENIKSAAYWESRNKAIARRLKLFGLSGNTEGIKEIDDGLAGTVKEYDTEKVLKVVDEIKKILPAQGKKGMARNETMFARAEFYKSNKVSKPVSLDGSLFNTFYPFNGSSQNTDSEAGESESKLEMANKVKETINFEFFLDTTGDIIFKPPFYNMDVRTHDPISIIRDEDIISFTYTEDAKQIVTRVDAFGLYTTYDDTGGAEGNPYGAYIDYALAREYGIVKHEAKRAFLKTDQLCVAYAIGELGRLNAERFSSSMTIIGRPELRLGYPIYVKSIDTFYYVTGISHSYSASGKMETSLELKGARRKYIQYDKTTGKVLAGAELVNNSGRSPKLAGVRNVVLTSDPYSILEEMEAFIKQGEQADEEFTTLKVKIEADKKRDTTEDEHIKDTKKQLENLWKKTQKDVGLLEKELKRETALYKQKLRQYESASKKTEKDTPSSQTPKKTLIKPDDAKLKEIQEKIKALQVEKARQVKEFEKLTAKSKEERAKYSEAEERLKKEFDFRVKEQVRAKELRRSAIAAIESLQKTLVTQVGGTNIDTTSQGILKVSSAYRGVEFQTFGRTIEIIKPGQLHADLSFIPVSDEFGYEVVGGFGYGRGNALYTNWRIKPVIRYSTTVYTHIEDEKTSSQPGIIDTYREAIESRISDISRGVKSPTVIDPYTGQLRSEADVLIESALRSSLNSAVLDRLATEEDYANIANGTANPSSTSNAITQAMRSYLNTQDPQNQVVRGGVSGFLDSISNTPISGLGSTTLGQVIRKEENTSSMFSFDDSLQAVEEYSKLLSKNIEQDKAQYKATYGTSEQMDSASAKKFLSAFDPVQLAGDSFLAGAALNLSLQRTKESLLDAPLIGSSIPLYKEKLRTELSTRVWYRNLTKDQTDSLSKTLRPGQRLKTTSVRNWTNPDLTVPDDSPDIHDAVREDLATGPLFRTPGNTSIYSGVGAYLTDFYSLPSLTGAEVQDVLRAETDQAIKDSNARSGYKDDLDELRRVLAADADPSKLTPIPDPKAPPPSKVDANKAQTGAGVARGGGGGRGRGRGRGQLRSNKQTPEKAAPPKLKNAGLTGSKGFPVLKPAKVAPRPLYSGPYIDRPMAPLYGLTQRVRAWWALNKP